MKTCKNCGIEIEDEAIFCHSCGARCREDEQAEGIVSASSVLNAVRNIASSKAFLAAVISCAAAILISIISEIALAEKAEKAITEFGQMYLNPEIFGVTKLHSSKTILAGVWDMIFPIVNVVGLWLIYREGLKRGSDTMNTAGFTIVKVITTINLVAVSVAESIVVISMPIACAGLIFAADRGEINSGIVICMIAILAAVILLLALSIVYYAKVRQILNTVKNTVKTGVPSNKISSYVIVVNYICVGVNGLGVLGTFLLAPFAAPMGFNPLVAILIGTLSPLCSIVSLMCFNSVLLRYRETMTRFRG